MNQISFCIKSIVDAHIIKSKDSYCSLKHLYELFIETYPGSKQTKNEVKKLFERTLGVKCIPCLHMGDVLYFDVFPGVKLGIESASPLWWQADGGNKYTNLHSDVGKFVKTWVDVPKEIDISVLKSKSLSELKEMATVKGLHGKDEVMRSLIDVC